MGPHSWRSSLRLDLELNNLTFREFRRKFRPGLRCYIYENYHHAWNNDVSCTFLRGFLSGLLRRYG